MRPSFYRAQKAKKAARLGAAFFLEEGITALEAPFTATAAR